MRIDEYLERQKLVELEDFDQEFLHLLDLDSKRGRTLAIAVNPIKGRTYYRVDVANRDGSVTTKAFVTFEEAHKEYFASDNSDNPNPIWTIH